MTRMNAKPGKNASPLAEAPRTGHVYLDTATRQVRLLNEAAREMHRDGVVFTPSELKPGVWQTNEGQTVEPADLPLVRAWREGKAVEAVFLRTREPGRTEQIRWTASLVTDEKGTIQGVLGTVTYDPSPVDWLHMAGLAHDLRTPLQTLRLSSALLEATVETDGNVAALVPRICAATDRAMAIARDLMDWCKAPFQSRSRNQGWVALEDFLLTLSEEMSMTAQKKGLSIICSIEESRGWEVNVDRVGLGRLLSNLLANAIRYTTSGRIELTARWREADPSRDATEPAPPDTTRLRRSSLLLSVVDTGLGIASQEQESIFQPFERGRGGKQDPDSGGSGLGLAVVDRLVEDLGLSMEVYSVLGQGSSFDVVVPMRLMRKIGELEVQTTGK